MECLLQELGPQLWNRQGRNCVFLKVVEQLKMQQVDLRVEGCLQSRTGQRRRNFLPGHRPDASVTTLDAVETGELLITLKTNMDVRSDWSHRWRRVVGGGLALTLLRLHSTQP